jgi:hypothetical protein
MRGGEPEEEHVQCVCAVHDMRQDMAELAALRAPDAVIANLPHNNNFKVRVCVSVCVYGCICIYMYTCAYMARPPRDSVCALFYFCESTS